MNKKHHPQDNMCANFQAKQTTLIFLAQICLKMDFGVGISKIKVWIRKQRLQYTMCSNFQSKWTSWKKLGLNLAKLRNYVRHFGSNNIEGVAESWVETEMSLEELGGARWRLKWTGWRWMELGGGGWRWVEVGTRFSDTQIKIGMQIPFTE